VDNAFDLAEDNEHAFVGADCGPRVNWQPFVQREPNGAWRCVNQNLRLVASDNGTEVNLLLLVQSIKELS
jgi:hypothetical protein